MESQECCWWAGEIEIDGLALLGNLCDCACHAPVGLREEGDVK